MESNDILKVTDNAVEKVFSLLQQENNPYLKLRVFVQGGGCSGFQYGFTFDDIVNDDDYVISKKYNSIDIEFLVDSMSALYLKDAEIDFSSSLQGEEFIIKNPHATSTCGCGSSFSI